MGFGEGVDGGRRCRGGIIERERCADLAGLNQVPDCFFPAVAS